VMLVPVRRPEFDAGPVLVLLRSPMSYGGCGFEVARGQWDGRLPAARVRDVGARRGRKARERRSYEITAYF
jgi:hypothetical protein